MDLSQSLDGGVGRGNLLVGRADSLNVVDLCMWERGKRLASCSVKKQR